MPYYTSLVFMANKLYNKTRLHCETMTTIAFGSVFFTALTIAFKRVLLDIKQYTLRGRIVVLKTE